MSPALRSGAAHDDRDQIEQLLSRISLRDAAALESLYRLVAGRLKAVAYRVMQDHAKAEDVLQEVFLSLWNQAGQRAPGQSLSLAWLCVITRNRAIDALRRKKPEQPLHWHDDEGKAQFHDVLDESGSPLEQLLAHEDGQRLGQCMGALEQEPRQAVVMAFYEGLTHSEIAQRMSRPLGTIKAWTRRSLMRLKACLEGVT
ncbi:sigma-70 family RNA polymerase sigma factor [soil metagenome]